VVAESSQGTVQGGDRKFTTQGGENDTDGGKTDTDGDD
jgi:hypothetical protein